MGEDGARPNLTENRQYDMSVSDKVIYRGRRVARSIGLGFLVAPAIMRFADQQPKLDSEVAKIAYAHDGRLVNKWDHYYRIYDRHFSTLRGTPVRLLEIGVSQGGSLQVWRKYFGDQAIIFGLDLDDRCAVVNDPPSINVRIGSQADEAFLKSVVEEMGGVDIVIDDGSHRASHLRTSFDVLFPLLSENGIYLAEDLHTNYWRGEYEGGWRRRSTFIEQMKDLVDDMHSWWHQRPQRQHDAHRTIGSICFYDSIVVVEKKPTLGPFAVQVGKRSF